VGGNVFLGFISAVAFATILAVVAGLTLSGASAVSHDLYATVIKKGKADGASELRVSKMTTVALGIIAVVLGIVFEKQNIAFMVSLAFAIAASATGDFETCAWSSAEETRIHPITFRGLKWIRAAPDRAKHAMIRPSHIEGPGVSTLGRDITSPESEIGTVVINAIVSAATAQPPIRRTRSLSSNALTAPVCSPFGPPVRGPMSRLGREVLPARTRRLTHAARPRPVLSLSSFTFETRSFP